MDQPTQTDPINPPTLDIIPDEQILSMLEGMRSRRLVLVIEHQRVLRIKQKAQHEQLVVKATKLATKIAKAIDKVDEYVAKVETYRHQIQALRIQALEFNEELGGE